MRVPGGFVAKAGLGVVRQRGDLCCRHVHRAHPGERGVVDDKIRAPGLQQRQEGAARLRHRGAEYGEAPVADLSNKAILAGVARRRVIDADPAGRREPGAQHRLVFGCQNLQPLAQQPHDLALGDLEPHAVQQRCQPLTGDLALKVTSSDEAAQLGAKTAEDARRQRRHDPLARRRLPALTAIARHRHADLQILDQHIFVTPEARARQHCRLELHFRRHRQSVAQAATAAPASLLAHRLCCLLHPRWLYLEPRPRRQTLQTRDLVLQCGNLGILQGQHCHVLIAGILKRRHLRDQSRNHTPQIRQRQGINRL